MRYQGIAESHITFNTPVVDEAADSLAIVEMVMELESEFGVAVPDSDYAQLRTIEDAVRYLRDRLREMGRNDCGKCGITSIESRSGHESD